MCKLCLSKCLQVSVKIMFDYSAMSVCRDGCVCYTHLHGANSLSFMKFCSISVLSRQLAAYILMYYENGKPFERYIYNQIHPRYKRNTGAHNLAVFQIEDFYFLGKYYY